MFNQTSGLDTGFGHEDDYNIYDKPLFADRTAASIYKGVKEVADDDEEEAQGDDKKTINKPGRGFEGTDYTKGARNKPVEFEKRKLEWDDDNFGEGGIKSREEPNKRRKME